MTTLTITQAVKQLIQGNVIAYPTEAVFGLGCDPDCEQAVLTILQIKQRPIEKGLILIAHSVEQLLPYIDITAITARQKKTLLNTWPGAVTWVVPKNRHTPYFLTGQFDSIAVRVTDHPLASQLCQLFGKPLVSTSANLSGLPPCRTRMEVEQQFGQAFPVLQGETGNNANPSTIRDSKTGQIIRQG